MATDAEVAALVAASAAMLNDFDPGCGCCSTGPSWGPLYQALRDALAPFGIKEGTPHV